MGSGVLDEQPRRDSFAGQPALHIAERHDYGTRMVVRSSMVRPNLTASVAA
jgi:hypothetical protein